VLVSGREDELMTAIATHPTRTTHSIRTTLPRAAGIIYVAAWVAGLAVHVSGPALDAPGAEVVTHYRTHGAAALTQSLLVHGVAAVALAAVVLGIGRAASVRHGSRVARTAVTWSGLSAAALSLAQMVAGVALVVGAGSMSSSRGEMWFAVVNRVDGVKMWALAVMALAGGVLALGRVLNRSLAPLAALLVPSLVVAGFVYGTLDASLAAAAVPALVLLLAWVATAGASAARAVR
jgi:hypothetical protein